MDTQKHETMLVRAVAAALSRIMNAIKMKNFFAELWKPMIG
jgi:hypothetical protein